jgi:opacity protein-like surface antigen
MASLTGRVGFAVDRVLLYTRGGLAWAHNKFEIEPHWDVTQQPDRKDTRCR